MDIALYTIHNCLWYTDRTIFKQIDGLGKPDPIVRPDKKLGKKGNKPKLQMHLKQDQKQPGWVPDFRGEENKPENVKNKG